MQSTSKYKLIDAQSGVENEIEASSIDNAVAAAEEWTRSCEWGNTETIWPRVIIYDADGERLESVDVAIDPPEPRCAERGQEHDWQTPVEIVGGISENPGCWGHGGGIIQHEVCMACGTERITDTWAQDERGRQGVTSTVYHAGRFLEQVEQLTGEVRQRETEETEA